MADRTRTWGHLVASVLVSGLSADCASSPVPAAPLAAPPGSIALPPAPASERLTRFVQLLPPEVSQREADLQAQGSVDTLNIPYGRGVFSLKTIRSSLPWCPVLRERGCFSYSVSTTGKSPTEEEWLSRTEGPPGPVVSTSKEIPSRHDWTDFFGGREAIFAVRSGAIDRIDDRGNVTPFIEDPKIHEWHKLWIIEIGGHTYVSAEAPSVNREFGEETRWVLAEALPPAAQGAPRKLSRFDFLPMVPAGGNAQSIRSINRLGSMAVHGDPQIFPLPDKGEQKARWAVAWLELVAPPPDWPEGKPYRSPGKKGAKNSCGRPSRGIDDVSVERRAHVTIFSGTEMVEDKIAWASNDLSIHGFVLNASLRDGGLSVAPPSSKPARQAYQTRALSGSQAPLPFLAERDVAAAFDARFKEGVVVVRAGRRLFSRRFDADGALIGAAVDLGEFDEHTKFHSLSRAENGWFAFLRGQSPSLVDLNAPRAPADLPYEHNALALYSEDGKLQVISFKEDAYWRTAIKDDGSISGDPVQIARIPKQVAWHRVDVVTAPDSPPLLLGPMHDAQLNFTGLAWITLRPGATWTTEETPPALSRLNQMTVRRLNGEVAVIFNRDRNGPFAEGVRQEMDEKWHIVWVKSRRSLTVDSKEYEQPWLSKDAAGPWLQATMGSIESTEEEPKFLPLKTLLLPETPGPPVEEPALEFVHRQCSRVLATGPSSLVLICAEAVDAASPGVRMGVRTFHINR